MEGLFESHDPEVLRRSIDQLGVVAFIIDVGTDDTFTLTAINAQHEQLTGMRHADVAGRSVDEILSPEMTRQVKMNYRRCVRERSAINYQETLELPIGTTYWRTTLVPYMDATGRVFRLLGTSFEVSHTVHLELETRYQSTVLGAYLDESPDGILVVDAENNMKTWNRRFLEIWDIPERIMEVGDGAAALAAVRRQLKEPEGFVSRILSLYENLDQEERGHRVEMLDGRVFERYPRGLRDSHGTYWGRIWFYRDVTERERMTQELQRLAWTDALTQASNRRAFMVELANEFRRARRYAHPLTVLMIDMDHFKSVNDRYGHEGGDAALRGFAAAVQPLLRDADHFARMGGEEFSILLPETNLEEGAKIAKRLRRIVEDVRVESAQGPFGMTVSVGLAEMHDDDETGEAILSRADVALYAAKKAGRNRVMRQTRNQEPREAD